MAKNNRNNKNKYDGQAYDDKSKKGKFNGSGDPRDEKSFDKKEVSRRDGERYSKKPNREILQMAGRENDFAWYNRNPQLIKDATHFSFYNQLGREVPDTNIDGSNFRIPGIMVLDTIPTIGYSATINDPASMAAIGMYEYIRSKLNKPNPDYEPADIEIAQFAKGDLQGQYANIMRLFGIIGTWNMDNLYYPRSIVASLYGMHNGDYEWTVNNLANLRARFNQLIYKASFLFMPADFAMFQRHVWMYSNLFRDHKSRKGQLYAYSKAYGWMWDETTYEEGSAAVAFKQFDPNYDKTPWDGTTHVLVELLDKFNECIEALRNSSSIRIMEADLRQAFGDRQEWKFAWCDEQYLGSFKAVDSDEVLSQIENTEYCDFMNFYENDFWTGSDLDVTQDVDTAAVIYKPTIATPEENYQLFASAYTKDKVINIHWDDPNESDIAVATRNKFTGHFSPNNEQFVIEPCSDVVLGYRINVNPDTDFECEFKWNMPFFNLGTVGEEAGSTQLRSTADAIKYFFAFDWCPMFHTIYYYSDQWITDLVLEWDNYTTIDADSVRRLNNACLNSLWSIPQYGAYEG